MLVKLSGINGDLEMYQDRLLLKKSWFLIRVFNAEKVKKYEIYYEEVVDCEYIKGTHFTNGSLKLKLKDRNEEIRFKKVSNPQAMKIYDFLKENLGMNLEDTEEELSGPEEIREYKRLFDDGIITREEFERKKKDILSR